MTIAAARFPSHAIPGDVVSASEWADDSLAGLLAVPPPREVLVRAQHAAGLGLGWGLAGRVCSWNDPRAAPAVARTLGLLAGAALTPDLRCDRGLTPLLAAAFDFHPLLAIAWADAGGDVAARSPDGRTVLHALVSAESRLASRAISLSVWGTSWLGAVIALVARGADPQARDADGKNLMDHVRLMSPDGVVADAPWLSSVDERLAAAHALWLGKQVPPAPPQPLRAIRRM